VRFRAERQEFAEAVTWTTRMVGSRPALPALAGVLLDVGDGRLTCRATDLEVSSEVSVPVQVEEPGRALLPGKLLAQLCSKLPDAPVVIEGTPDRTTIRCGRATFGVRGMPVDDFPTFHDADPDAPRGVLKAEAFGRLVSQVARAASTDEARPFLTGVRLEASAGALTAAATDSYRLAIRRVTWDEGADSDALVPARALTEAGRAATDAGGEVTIVFEAGRVSFLLGDRRLTTRLVEGSFPNYRQLVPDAHETRAVADRLALIESLQRVAVVALGQTNTPITLAFGEGTIDLAAGNQEVGDATEALPAEVTGEPLTIAFNPGYLLSGLEAVTTEEVEIDLRDGLKPAVIRPRGGEAPADDFLYLIMPVRTS